MKVQCNNNTGINLLEGYLDPAGGIDRAIVFDVTPGQIYSVYGVSLHSGQVWYYLCGDLHPYYPVLYPAILFSLVNKTLSKYWIFEYTPQHPDHQALFTFEDWASDPYFYDRLTDYDENALVVFKKYKELIDIE